MGESYYRLKKALRPSSQTVMDHDIYLYLGPAKANKWSNLKALSKAELLPPGAANTGLPSRLPTYISTEPHYTPSRPQTPDQSVHAPAVMHSKRFNFSPD